MNDAPQIMDQTDKKVFTIILVVVGVICIVVAGVTAVAFYAVNTANEKQKASLATEQAYATSTAVSVTSTAVYQATQVANYEFFDDFKDNQNNWETGQEDNKYWKGSISIRDGAYVWDVKEFYKSDSARSWRDYKNAPFVTDFDLSVDAKLATPDSQLLCYAVVFRCSPSGISSGSYIFYVCDHQRFAVEYENDLAEGEMLTPWTYSDAIRSGDWNTLAVSARGDHFVLSINNVVVSEFTDDHRGSGYVHLMVQFYEQTPGTVMFDNFGLRPR